MASHYISSSIATQTFKLYKNSSATSQVIEILPQNSQITVIDEYFGRTCEYHYVSSSTNAGFLLNEYIYPLSGTAPSAPYVCGAQPVPSYAEPSWYTLPETEPFVNEATNEYCICVTSDALTPAEVDEDDILKRGVKGLLRFYNKSGSYDDSIIETYLNYYIFAKIKDDYVPFRPLMRTKHLVAIPAKYFDAIEEDKIAVSITPLERDISDVDFVLKIDLKELTSKFDSVASLLRLYGADLYSSNSTLVFSTSTLFGNEQIRQNPGVDEMDFAGKAENVVDFKNRLENLLMRNGYNPNPSPSMIDEVNVQFAINSECNILYDIAVEVNGQCFKLRKGIESFLKSEPVTDPTTIAFVKQVHNINKIDKCKVPWYDFAEQYVYPPVEVQAPVIDDSEPDYVFAMKLFNLFVSFQDSTSQKPIKTWEELRDEELEKFKQDYNYLMLQLPLMKYIFEGDNELDSTNLDKTFKKIERAVYNNPLINKDTYAVKKDGEFYELSPNTAPLSESGSFSVGTISVIERSTFRLYTPEPSVLIDGVETNVYFSSKSSQKKTETQNAKEAISNGLNKIWEFIQKIGICKIIDLLWGCLMALCRALGINVDAVIQASVFKNFDYDQMINDIIPYLPAEQQQFLYEQLLTELGCVNQAALLNILKNYLSSDEYTTLNLESSGATYEDIIKVVAEKMIITTVSE